MWAEWVGVQGGGGGCKFVLTNEYWARLLLHSKCQTPKMSASGLKVYGGCCGGYTVMLCRLYSDAVTAIFCKVMAAIL